MERKVVRAGIAAAALLAALALIPSAPVTAAGKPIRLTGAGNSYAGFSKVGIMVLTYLKKQFPDRDMWIDYHEAGTRFRDGMLALGDGQADIVFANTPHLVAMAYKGAQRWTRRSCLCGHPARQTCHVSP